jgi:hypothetical protein
MTLVERNQGDGLLCVRGILGTHIRTLRSRCHGLKNAVLAISAHCTADQIAMIAGTPPNLPPNQTRLPRPHEYSADSRIVACARDDLAPRFEELEDLLVLFRGEIGAHAHVHHCDFPLGGT